jgi:catechol 2,3-dioxygenase-like lactoylglutathione lyase family enzyme
MAKLRHIAFIVKEPDKLYDFYHHLFGVEKVRHGPTGAIHVIDGLFNLAFLKQSFSDGPVVNTHRADGEEIDQRQGINHYGFLVDDVEKTLTRLGDSIQRGQTPQNGRPAEMRIIDPWGNKVDLAARGFLGREERKLPGVRYVVVQTETPEQTAEFYRSVFELERLAPAADGSLRLSDGDITLELTKKLSIDKPGIQYFGVQVKDWSQAKSRFQEIGLDLPDPKRGETEVQVRDPEGNLFTVSEKGWQR